MAMRCGIIIDHAFTRHLTPPGHPERPERITTLMDALNSADLGDQLTRFAPERAATESILKVHSDRLYRVVERTAGLRQVSLDADTMTSPDSFETSLLAAGSGIRLAQLIRKGEIDAGFLLARPPGHHAETDRSMGFCLFNNIAVVCQWAIENELASRIAIVDFDVHHGNGTQEIFYSRDDVLYISSHQYPFYPGTGAFRETGLGPGQGYSLNFPLRAGTGDSFYYHLYKELVVPVVTEYQPDLILVSAGYDAHADDPLGGMLLSVEGYAALASMLNELAESVASRRILYILEGGYNLRALTDCVIRTIEVTLRPSRISLPETQTKAFDFYSESARNCFSPYWNCLS